MSTTALQTWVAIFGAFLTVGISAQQFLGYQRRRDRLTRIGDSFSSNIDALAEDNATKQMAAAIVLRRYFDPNTEQGQAGRPYQQEAINVIAGLLRDERTESDPRLNKALADGLRYARDLRTQDFTHCDFTDAYLGRKKGDTWVVDMSAADFFEATLDRASFKEVTAERAVFCGATAQETVFTKAVLTEADFRDADLEDARFDGASLDGAQFAGARIAGADFAGAIGVPADVAGLLDAATGRARADAVVPARARNA